MARRVRRRILRRDEQKNKKKWIYFAAASTAVLLLAVVLLVVRGHRFFVAEQGTLVFSMDGEGLIVRSETLYKAENYGKTEFIATEGQAVSAGTSIADVYSEDYSESDYAALKELREKILDYQQNNALGDAVNEGLASLDTQIASKAEEIRQAVREGLKDLLLLERSLCSLMDERATLLKEAAKNDTQLTDFYAQEEALGNRVENYRRTIVAEGEGLVSFYFDGIETLLTPENMEKLTVKDIENIIAGKLNYTTVTEYPLYRLVERDLWYVVMVSGEEISEFSNDNTFYVQFSFGDVSQATVYGWTEEAGKYIYYLEFDKPVDKFLSARQVEFSVSATYVGIEVPASAVKKKDGVAGVYYLDEETGRKTFEPVNVLIARDDRSLVEPQDIGSVLDAGSKIYY